MKFDLLKSKYIKHLEQNDKLAELTVRNYVNDINTFKQYLESQSQKNIGELNKEDFRYYFVFLFHFLQSNQFLYPGIKNLVYLLL